MGRGLRAAGGKPHGGVHGDRAHRQEDPDPLHGLLEGGGREDRGQLRLRRLPARDGAARQGRLRGPRLGSVRPRGARAARTQD